MFFTPYFPTSIELKQKFVASPNCKRGAESFKKLNCLDTGYRKLPASQSDDKTSDNDPSFSMRESIAKQARRPESRSKIFGNQFRVGLYKST